MVEPNPGQVVFRALAMRVETANGVPSPLAGAEGQDEGSAMNGVDVVDMSLLHSASESKPEFRLADSPLNCRVLPLVESKGLGQTHWREHQFELFAGRDCV